MGVYRTDLVHKGTGRIKGSYVYMLLCRDKGPIYIKVGLTDSPTNRLMSLRNGCPITPIRFACAESYSREKARKIERDLHKALKPWKKHGEWYVMTRADKTEFNKAWKGVFNKHAKPNWPLKWEQVDIKRWIISLANRKAYFQKLYATRGKAYRDFCDVSKSIAA